MMLQHDSCVPRLVLIEWEDSHGDGSWQQLDGEIEDRALICRSVGWLILDGERAKVVAPHLSEQGCWCTASREWDYDYSYPFLFCDWSAFRRPTSNSTTSS